MKDFSKNVLKVVASIPKGHTMSYKEVALKAGNPLASRAVGMVMSRNTDKSVPCHRVIRSDGIAGDYNGLSGGKKGIKGKIALLKKEGIRFTKRNRKT